MFSTLKSNSGPAALAVAMLALGVAISGIADAKVSKLAGKVVKLDKHGKVPKKQVPAVNAAGLTKGGKKKVYGSCSPTTVDLGTWCLQASPYPLANQDSGKNDYFFATAACKDAGGWLPDAGELIGAAAEVKLASTIGDSRLTASIDEDASDGLRDRREMSSTLVTTASGSQSAGSEGVSDGSRGDPRQGEPDPVPFPANPAPDTLQYVTVYDNGNHGGFAGSRPVSEPENFRCAFAKKPGAYREKNN